MTRINKKITILLIIFILSLVGTVILTFVDTGIISNAFEVNASATHQDHTDWIDLNNYGSNMLASGNYYLSGRLDSNLVINEGSNVTLCLNGQKLIGDGTTSVINVSYKATLTIEDCDNTTTHQYYIDSTGLWKFDDGTQQWKDAYNNAGVDKRGIVLGGVITNGNGIRGGGVSVEQSEGTFNMRGGTISGNKADTGSAVSVSYGKFNMQGGTISGNKADNGGIVFNGYGYFNMQGGTIADNTCSENFAGIILQVSTYNEITNGYIKDRISFVGFTLEISGGYFAENKIDNNEIQDFVPDGAEVVELEQNSEAYKLGYRYTVHSTIIRIDTSGSSRYDGLAIANKHGFEITVNKNGEAITEYNSTFQYAMYGSQDFVEGLPANAGKYTVKVIVNISDELYEEQFDYEITKATLTISDLQAVARQYDGTTKVQLVGNLEGVIGDDDVKLHGTGTVASADIGTYKVDSCEFLLNGASADNYVVSSTTYEIYAEITAKVLQVKWSNTILIYNGTAQKPTATVDTGIEGEKLNLVVDGSGTELGTYTATASMQIANNNYKLTNTTTEFLINIASLSSHDGKVTVTAKTGFSKGWTLEAIELVDLTSISNLPDGQSVLTAYDIKLKNGEQTVQPYGKVQVTIKLTEQQQKASKLNIYTVAEDGTMQLIESVVNGDSITFETEHLSVYAITASAQIDNLFIIIIIVLGALFIIEMCIYGVFLYKTQKIMNDLQ